MTTIEKVLALQRYLRARHRLEVAMESEFMLFGETVFYWLMVDRWLHVSKILSNLDPSYTDPSTTKIEPTILNNIARARAGARTREIEVTKPNNTNQRNGE